MPQSLSQTLTSCAAPGELSPANDTGAPATAGGRVATGNPPTPGHAALIPLVRRLGRQAARDLFLAQANDDGG